MRHYFDTVFNTSGGPVQGVKVRLTDAAGNAVPIFSDDSGTRLAGDTAISNARGLFEFYAPFATYNLNYYSPSETLIQVIPNVYMGSDATDALIDAVGAAVDAKNVAEASAVRTGLDVETTHADVVQTHADVLLTHADVAATGADRVQTGIDAAAAAASADRIDLGAFDADVLQVRGDRVQTGLDRIATGIDVQTTAANALIATNNATTAVAASTGLGVFANAAAANIPRGVVSFATTGGSGGADGLNLAASFTGGTLTYNPQIFYDVVGGAVTNVRMTFSGLYIGAGTPTMPTVVLANGAGGAAVTLAGGRLFAAGQGWWAVSADGRTLDRYVNVGNVATADGSMPSVYLKPAINEVYNAGGTKNYFPDPFFTNTTLAGGLGSAPADPPFTLSGAWDPIADPTTASPYPSGKVLVRPSGNVTVPQMNLYFDNMGLAAGDTIQIAQEIAFLDGISLPFGAFCVLDWFSRGGATMGPSVNIVVASAGNPLTGVYKSFNSGNLTIPAGAAFARLQWPQVTANPRGICSFQVVKVVNGNSAPAKPIQRLPVPDASNRIADLEDHDPANPKNNVLMRRTTYVSATSAYPVGVVGPLLNTYNNNSGYGQSFLSAACPAAGFNCVSTPLNWQADPVRGPARIMAIVRTCATGGNPLNVGRTIAWGYIDTDPLTGTAGSEPIQLFDPVTGAPKTVMPSDLLDLMGIAISSQNVSGGVTPSTQLFVTYGTFSNADPAIVGWQAIGGIPGGLASPWTSIGGAVSWVPKLLLAVSPVTAVKTPSASFAAQVAGLVDEPPAFIAMPRKVYCVVGREASLYYDAVQQRDPKRTNFRAAWSAAVPAGSGAQEERIKYVPTAAGTNTLTLTASRGDTLSSTGTCDFVTVAASAAAGNKVVHCIGDSLIENAGMLAALKAIADGQAVTTLTFIGSKGNAPLLNDGYSGKSLGAFRGSVLAGVGPNPFYNPGTLDFDYAYWKANTGASFTAADFVFLEAGGVDVGSPTSDVAAQSAADSWAVTAEFMVASIRAANPSAKIVLYTKEAGPVPGEEPSPVYGPTWRVRRNWRVLAAKQISQFSGRETSGIYVSPSAAAIDPEYGWGRVLTPRNAAVTRDLATYASYAAMIADLSKSNGVFAYATDVAAYFVKVGPPNLGRWRDARLEDGFIMRHTDTVHYANGAIQVAEANWAVIKNFG